MAKNQDSDRVSVSAPQPPRPVITLPPRPSAEALFAGGSGASPGPMTLVSNFFSDTYPDSEYRSFSQLLAGAMGSPMGMGSSRPIFFSENPVESSAKGDSENGAEKNSGFKQSRPMNLMVARSGMMEIPAHMASKS